MKGARRYADLFKTGQYGRLYLVSGSHARGKTFRIYILPDGNNALPNGEHNPPLNTNAVEVYGVVSGNPGWTESYDWIHRGKWQNDFYEIEQEALKGKRLKEEYLDSVRGKREKEEKLRTEKLLNDY